MANKKETSEIIKSTAFENPYGPPPGVPTITKIIECKITPDKKPPEIRKKVFYISQHDIKALFLGMVDIGLEWDVPKNFEIVNIYYDYLKDCFGVVLKSGAFEEVAEGDCYPIDQSKRWVNSKRRKK